MENPLATFVTYNPWSVSLDTTVADLLRMVEELKMHHFPVVDASQRLVGVVSETDVIRNAQSRPLSHDTAAEEDLLATVRDILSTTVHTIEHSATPRQALRLLMDHRIHSLPVLEQGRLVGMVTTSDFLREFSYGQMTCAKEPVSDFLETPPEPLEPDATIDEALAAMKKAGMQHFAVVQGGCPVGVVSQSGLTKALALGATGRGKLPVTGNSPVIRLIRKTPTIRPGQRMNEAATMMLDQGLHALAVTNQGNRFLGLVCDDDILRVMYGQLR